MLYLTDQRVFFFIHKLHKRFLPYERTKSVSQTIATEAFATPALAIINKGAMYLLARNHLHLV